MHKIKIKNVNGIPLVKVKVKNSEGYMSIDTGASITTINNNYFNLEGIVEKVKVFDKIIKEVDVVIGLLDCLEVENLTFENINVKQINFDYVESKIKIFEPNIKYYGTIGLDILSQYKFCINYNTGYLLLNHELPYYKEIKYEEIDEAIIINVIIDGEKYKFLVDSSANAALINEKIDTSKFGKISDTIYTIKKLTIEGLEVKDIPTIKTSLGLISQKIPNLSGLIGYQFLSKYLVTFCISEKKLKISSIIKEE